MMTDAPILVTGAGGGVGSVGRRVVTLLRERDLPVRAMVHRYGDHADEQADALCAVGAQLIAGDLTRPDDVAPGAGRRRPDAVPHERVRSIIRPVRREAGSWRAT